MREARRTAPRLSPVITLRILLMVWATLVAVPAIPNAVAAYQQTDQTLPTPKVLSADWTTDDQTVMSEDDKPNHEAAASVDTASDIVVTSTKKSPIAASPQDTDTPEHPYRLVTSGVAADLATIGMSLSDLNASSIAVMGNYGAIPKRCSSGQAGTSYSQGLALKKNAVYKACPDGTQPVYDAYRPKNYRCSVIYNVNHPKRLAILVHEVAHCKYFSDGQYKEFDADYKKLRGIEDFGPAKVSELVADDYMICIAERDTNWGSGSYYSRYGVDKLTTSQCAEFKQLVAANL